MLVAAALDHTETAALRMPHTGPHVPSLDMLSNAMCPAWMRHAVQAMVLNGGLQVASALLMVGLAGWMRGWCSRRNKSMQHAPQPAYPSDSSESGGSLIVGALLASGIPEEEPPGTVPDLAVELSVTHMVSPLSGGTLQRRKSGESHSGCHNV